MTLDVEVPDPPPLRGPQSHGEYAAIDMTGHEIEDDYRRGEVEAILADGAWVDAFDEWAAHTLMTEAEFEVATDAEMFEALDFYWDPASGEVGYRAPTLAADVRAELDDRDNIDADGIDEGLDSLGRVVSETLENDYLRRESDEFGFFTEEYTGDDSTAE